MKLEISDSIFDDDSAKYDQTEKTWLRLPYLEEFSTSLANGSGTPFWTMSSSDRKLYFGNRNSENELFTH